MSSIQNVGQTNNVNRTPTQKPVTRAETPTTSRRADSVEISNLSSMLTKLKANDIRHDKVAEIKAQIEKGSYENDAKLDAAIDKLIDDLA